MPHQGGKTDMNALLRKAGFDARTVVAGISSDALLQKGRRAAGRAVSSRTL